MCSESLKGLLCFMCIIILGMCWAFLVYYIAPISVTVCYTRCLAFHFALYDSWCHIESISLMNMVLVTKHIVATYVAKITSCSWFFKCLSLRCFNIKHWKAPIHMISSCCHYVVTHNSSLSSACGWHVNGISTHAGTLK